MADASDEDEGSILVLLRARIANLPSVVEGSIVVTANCGHKAFIAPQGYAELERQHESLYLVCSDCIDVDELFNDPTQTKAYVPGATAAISKHLGWHIGQEDQFRASMRDLGFIDEGREGR